MKRLLLMIVILMALSPAQGVDFFSRSPDSVPAEVEAMYVKGLNALVQFQQRAGNWNDGEGGGPGVVGLAILAMLAHGDDPNDGPYSVPIKRGLDFLLHQQSTSTGYIGGTMYHHGFATLALAEAYGAVDDKRIGPALKRAVDFITSSQAQNPRGAWRYSPDSQDADTTVSGAQMVALLAARNAGIPVAEDAVQKGVKFFLTCQSSDGGIGYTSSGDPNDTRTAIGALVLVLARQKDGRGYPAAVQYLRGSGGGRNDYPFYHEYYAAQAFFHGDPEAWQQWNAANIRRLATTQGADGAWTGNHGRTFCTSAALLSLALNYRFLPIYER